MARQRNYAAEFAARNERAKALGIPSYGVLRRVRTEVAKTTIQQELMLMTGTRTEQQKARDIVAAIKYDMDKQRKSGVIEKNLKMDPELQKKLFTDVKKLFADPADFYDMLRELY
jgi:hypothetical protein